MSTKSYSILIRKYKSLISALHSIYRLINTAHDATDLVPRLAKLLSQIFKSDTCTIGLLDNSKKQTTFKCSILKNKRIINTKKSPLKNKLERRIVLSSSTIKQDYLLTAPLISDDVIGFIIISKKKKITPKEEGTGYDSLDHETLMTLAGQIVMAIKNLQLYNEQQKLVVGTIKSLVTVLDSKMPPAYTHTPYFSRLVMTLAEEMHLDRKDIETLRYASMLHDAGKIDIPVEILTKSSQLTGEEYDIIKCHPVKGAEIIKHLQILKPVIPLILHHHEKYDGTGYPSHLKEKKIPIGARIMAVADAFDAMVYGRPYKERMSAEAALEEIKKYSGTQFDPAIVKCLMKIFLNKKLKKYLHLTR